MAAEAVAVVDAAAEDVGTVLVEAAETEVVVVAAEDAAVAEVARRRLWRQARFLRTSFQPRFRRSSSFTSTPSTAPTRTIT